MLTHYNMVAMLRQMEEVDVLTADDVMCCVVPCYHLYGLHIVMNLGLRRGVTIVTLPRYDPGGFMRALQDYQVSIAPIVPPIVLALGKILRRELVQKERQAHQISPANSSEGTAHGRRPSREGSN